MSTPQFGGNCFTNLVNTFSRKDSTFCCDDSLAEKIDDHFRHQSLMAQNWKKVIWSKVGFKRAFTKLQETHISREFCALCWFKQIMTTVKANQRCNVISIFKSGSPHPNDSNRVEQSGRNVMETTECKSGISWSE